MNIFSLKTGNLIINWLPYSYTHTMPERLAPQPDRVWKWQGFDSLPVCMKSSFIRHCCFNNDPWYVKGVTGTHSSSMSAAPSTNLKCSVGPCPGDALVIVNQREGSKRLTFEIVKTVRKPVYHHHYYLIFWNFKILSSEMVKNPFNMVEGNIEISCYEMTIQSNY